MSQAKITRNKVSQVRARIRRNADRRLEKIAGRAADEIRERAPVSDNSEPGHVHMRDAIFVVERRRGWSVEIRKPYAIYVEYGTVDSDAQPFIRPAVADIRKQIPKLLENILD